MAYVESTSQVSSFLNSYGSEASKFDSAGGSKFYEVEPAIVTQVEFDGVVGKIKAYALLSKSFIIAYPSNQNIKFSPIPGEIVTFKNHKLSKNSSELITFYEPISWNHSSHLNNQEFFDLINSPENKDSLRIDIKDTKGAPENLPTNKVYTGKYFKFDDSLDKKSVMFEGDIMFEGRSGQSIRFGSSVPSSIKFDNTNYNNLIENADWIYSDSKSSGGKPFIILSSGKTNINAEYYLEDIQNDPSTIFMSSGGFDGSNLPFLLSAIENKSKNVKIPSTYNSNLILLNSDRIIFNSKVNSIVLSSNYDIIGMSNKNIYFKTENILELDASVINLGESAQKDGQAIVKSDDLIDFLNQMIDAILNLKYDSYGMIIPLTDFPLLQLKAKLKLAADKTNKFSVFSSDTTFTL